MSRLNLNEPAIYRIYSVRRTTYKGWDEDESREVVSDKQSIEIYYFDCLNATSEEIDNHKVAIADAMNEDWANQDYNSQVKFELLFDGYTDKLEVIE